MKDNKKMKFVNINNNNDIIEIDLSELRERNTCFLNEMSAVSVVGTDQIKNKDNIGVGNLNYSFTDDEEEIIEPAVDIDVYDIGNVEPINLEDLDTELQEMIDQLNKEGQ